MNINTLLKAVDISTHKKAVHSLMNKLESNTVFQLTCRFSYSQQTYSALCLFVDGLRPTMIDLEDGDVMADAKTKNELARELINTLHLKSIKKLGSIKPILNKG